MTLHMDAPIDLLNYFRVDAGTGDVRWTTAAELERLPSDDRPRNWARKKLPFGQRAGSRAVHGHGRIVLCSGRQLLTNDLAWAVREHWWPWDVYPNRPALFTPEPDDVDAIDMIRRTWTVNDNDDLVWLIEPHRDVPEGSVVRGTHLAGRGDAAVSRRLKLYVTTDIRHVLAHGRFPWQPETKWD